MDNDVLLSVDRSSALYHHGIDGQKWGHKNGPPYPLSRSGKWSAAERRENKRLAKEAKKIKAEEKQEKKDAKRATVSSKAYKSAKNMTDNELKDSINRLQNEKKYIELTKEINDMTKLQPTKWQKVKSYVKKEATTAAKLAITKTITKGVDTAINKAFKALENSSKDDKKTNKATTTSTEKKKESDTILPPKKETTKTETAKTETKKVETKKEETDDGIPTVKATQVKQDKEQRSNNNNFENVYTYDNPDTEGMARSYVANKWGVNSEPETYYDYTYVDPHGLNDYYDPYTSPGPKRLV